MRAPHDPGEEARIRVADKTRLGRRNQVLEHSEGIASIFRQPDIEHPPQLACVRARVQRPLGVAEALSIGRRPLERTGRRMVLVLLCHLG